MGEHALAIVGMVKPGDRQRLVYSRQGQSAVALRRVSRSC
jgi:hypothetical protein